MLSFVLLLIGISCIVALANWRWGIALAIVVGLIQDPLRKLVPGTPGFLAMASAPVWLATMASALYVNQLSVSRFFSSFPRLGRWTVVLFIYLAIPAALSATYGRNSWRITALGAFVYFTMFLALVAGWRYPDGGYRTGRLLTFYVAVASLVLVGGPLDFMGWSERFAVIGTEAMGHIWVTYRTGTGVHMLAGFFRGPDVMGWHAALVFMISVIMAFRSRGVARVFWIALATWGGLNIWLCGRRKMLSMIPIFMGCYLFLIFRFKEVRRFASIAGTVLMIGGLVGYLISSLYRDTAVEAFYLTAFTEAGEQLQRHGIDTVFSTVKQFGFWGCGLGMSQQGIHHISAEMPELWQESGPGKIVAEFGVPGAVLIALLGWVLIQTAYCVVRRSRKDESFYFTAGIFSIVVANLTSAVVSAQIYGDPFVSLLLAFLVGLLLSEARAVSPGEETS
jgi:hypothetical protein